MTRLPLVSVVVIFLDAEHFLAEAVDSVLGQTFSDWELILVDDGSTDGSTSLAIKYASADPARIQCVSHEHHANRGMSASRNLGLASARGEFLAFLDSDDLWLPQKLERQVEALSMEQSVSMVYNASMLWYSWMGGENIRRDRLRKLGVTPGTIVSPPALVPLYLRREALPPSTCGAMIRRSAALTVGGFDNAFPGMFEDQVFFYKMALTHSIAIQDGYYDLYRQHPNSHCHVTSAIDTDAAELRFLIWLESYLNKMGVGTPEVYDALKARLFRYRHPRLYAASRRLRQLTNRWPFAAR